MGLFTAYLLYEEVMSVRLYGGWRSCQLDYMSETSLIVKKYGVKIRGRIVPSKRLLSLLFFPENNMTRENINQNQGVGNFVLNITSYFLRCHFRNASMSPKLFQNYETMSEY